MTSKLRSLLVSPATYPLSAFWLVATVILPLSVDNVLSLDVGVGIMTAVAVALILVAFKRDLDSVHAQHAVLVERVQQLIEALVHEAIPIPPVHTRGVHRKVS